MQAAATDIGGDDLLFEAVVVPHRSLSTRGLCILIGVICGLSMLTSSVFWLLGAWPVAGFSGVEITAAILLIRANARSQRQSELIMLTTAALQVIRTDEKGRRQVCQLDPAWLNVVLEERPGRVPALLLAARGQREEIAGKLGEAEKRDLAQALAAALHRRRHPVFDNPQLR